MALGKQFLIDGHFPSSVAIFGLNVPCGRHVTSDWHAAIDCSYCQRKPSNQSLGAPGMTNETLSNDVMGQQDYA